MNINEVSVGRERCSGCGRVQRSEPAPFDGGRPVTCCRHRSQTNVQMLIVPHIEHALAGRSVARRREDASLGASGTHHIRSVDACGSGTRRDGDQGCKWKAKLGRMCLCESCAQSAIHGDGQVARGIRSITQNWLNQHGGNPPK